MSRLRLFTVVLVLIAGIFASRRLTRADSSAHRPLDDFPRVIAAWHSQDLPFDANVVREIGADDYTNREYFGSQHPVELYIGYYQDQRSGEAIHSPKNCLPGEGWEPVRSSRLPIVAGDHRVTVNEYIVEKGSRRDLVLYWYQTHGRVVASEYWAKFWLVADGVRHKPTDGAMIRIWTTAADGEASAQARAADFARSIYPTITDFLSK